MRKLNQPFEEFGNSLSVSIQGVDIRTADGKRSISLVYGEMARFILACRSIAASTGNSYDAKSIRRPLWQGKWSKINDQEYLNARLFGGVPSKITKEDIKKLESDKLCMLILHGSNQITYTDMDTITEGDVGVVLGSKTLGASDFNQTPPQFDSFGAPLYRTTQLRTSNEMGAVALSYLKYQNGSFKCDDYAQLLAFGPASIQCAALSNYAFSFSSYPALYCSPTLIYANKQAFAKTENGLVEVNGNVWGEDPLQGGYEDPGYLANPAWIDANGRAWFYIATMILDQVIDVTINNNGTAFFDQNLGEAYTVPNSVDVIVEPRSRSLSGGMTNYPYATAKMFPVPYLTQIDGLDVLNTRECSTANAYSNFDFQTINFQLDDFVVDYIPDYGEVLAGNQQVGSFPYPYKDWKKFGYRKGSDSSHVDQLGNVDFVDLFDTAITAGICSVANGKHYLQGWMVRDENRFAMDGVDCKAKLEAAIKGSAQDFRAAFMDVPLSAINLLK